MRLNNNVMTAGETEQVWLSFQAMIPTQGPSSSLSAQLLPR